MKLRSLLSTVCLLGLVALGVQAAVQAVPNQEKEVMVEPVSCQFSFDYHGLYCPKTGTRIEPDQTLGQLKLAKGLTSKKSVEMVSDEGETMREHRLIVSDASGELFDLPYGMFDGKGYIDSMIVRSPKIKNQDGVGVGTTVDEFLRTYPFAKLYYTYVNDRLWLSNGVDGVDFLLPGATLPEKATIDSDWMEMAVEKLSKEAVIEAVEIAGRPFDYKDRMGDWESKDQVVQMILFERDGQPYYNLTVGENILNLYEGRLYAVSDALYSDPSGHKYHVTLMPANGDLEDGTEEMTVILRTVHSSKSDSYILYK